MIERSSSSSSESNSRGRITKLKKFAVIATPIILTASQVNSAASPIIESNTTEIGDNTNNQETIRGTVGTAQTSTPTPYDPPVHPPTYNSPIPKTSEPNLTLPPTPLKNVMDFGGWMLGAITSFLTLILSWKKEARDAKKAKLEFQREQLEIEKLKSDLKKGSNRKHNKR